MPSKKRAREGSGGCAQMAICSDDNGDSARKYIKKSNARPYARRGGIKGNAITKTLPIGIKGNISEASRRQKSTYLPFSCPAASQQRIGEMKWYASKPTKPFSLIIDAVPRATMIEMTHHSNMPRRMAEALFSSPPSFVLARN